MDHVRGALAHEGLKGALELHLLGRARHVHGHGARLLLKVEAVLQEGADELDGLEDGEFQQRRLDVVLDVLQARRRVADNRMPPVVRSLEQRRLELLHGHVRGVDAATRVEHQAAALLAHGVGVDDLAAGLVHQRDEALRHAALLRVRRRGAHDAGHARGHVDDLARKGGGLHGHGARHGRHRGQVGQRPCAGGHVRVPERDEAAADLVHQRRDRLDHRRAQDAVRQRDSVEDGRRDDIKVPKVPDHGVGHSVGHGRRRAQLGLADRLDELARVDLDGALLLTHAVGCAHVQAHVLVLGSHGLQAHGVGGREDLWRLRLHARQAVDLAPDGDALPRRQRRVARRAVGLAKAALDARVDEVVRQRRRLEVLQVEVRVRVEQHARVKDKVLVEQSL
mmetsp:Transcript_13718/g.45752  ORF Transcript_13718/g.45752 Transcript_13718/m.45752 type:complete len:394 (+) Transcript_13718:344-1525(+)